MTERVFITGAEGFIGSHIVEHFVARGWFVTAYCLYNSFNNPGWLGSLSAVVLKNVRIIYGDIRDLNHLKESLEQSEASLVIHLAALIAIPYSYRAPQSYIHTNVEGTLNVLQACKECCISRLIHTSTSEVYGSARFVPMDETHVLQAQSPYSASKIAADQIAYSYYCSYDLPVVTLRPFNTFGPRQSNRAIIPTIISQLLQRCNKVELGSLTPTRDFTFVSDTADAFYTAGTGSGGEGQVFNVGSNFEISIGEIVDLVAEILGVKPEIVLDTKRCRPERSEVDRLWANNEKFVNAFDWEPQNSGEKSFLKGLENTVDWFKNPSNLAVYPDNGYVI